MKKLLALVLALSLAMSMVVMTTASAAPLTEFHTSETQAREIETLCIQHSELANDLNVLVNCLDGLLANDAKGALIPNAAASYEVTENGTVYTFTLQDGMTWVDYQGNYKADVVAQDWVTAMEFIMNFAKNGAANTSMPSEMIAGAAEYYEYTKKVAEEQGTEAAMALTPDNEEFQKVGVKALDAKTLQYTLVDALPYFPTVATSACLYPVSQALLDELGVEGYLAVTYDQLWYNGAYTITEYENLSSKTLTKNPAWWNTEADRFEAVTIQMVEDVDKAYNLFLTGELDQVDLSISALKTIADNPNHEFYKNLTEKLPRKYSYQMHLCFDVKNEDGTPYTDWNAAVANVNFRRALYYGMELTPYLERTNALAPFSCENYGYTGKGVSVTSDGVDYAQLVLNEMGMEYDRTCFNRYDAEKAAAFKAAAIEELTAAGVQLPVQMRYYISGASATALQSAQTLQQVISDGLGDDLVQLEIKTFVSSQTQEVRNPQLGCCYINGWGADFGDPVNFLGQETYGEDSAFYSTHYSMVNNTTDAQLIADYKEFTALEKEAAAILDDLDARYAAFAKAEAYFLDHAFTIPMSIEINMQLSCVNVYSAPNAAYGIYSYWYVNWESNDQIYTTEEYAALKGE